LATGQTRSCGCLQAETLKERLENKYINGTDISVLNGGKVPNSRNTSGVIGVTFDKENNKWRATIVFQKKKYELGRHVELEDAAAARKTAEEKLYGDFIEWYNETYPDKKLSRDGKIGKRKK